MGLEEAFFKHLKLQARITQAAHSQPNKRALFTCVENVVHVRHKVI